MFRVPYFSGSARSTCQHYVGAFLCVKCVFVVAVSPLVRLKGIKKLLLLVVRIPSGVHGHVIALEKGYILKYTFVTISANIVDLYRLSFQFKVLNFSTRDSCSTFKEYRYCFFLLATHDKATSRIVCLIDCCIYVLFCTILSGAVLCCSSCRSSLPPTPLWLKTLAVVHRSIKDFVGRPLSGVGQSLPLRAVANWFTETTVVQSIGLSSLIVGRSVRQKAVGMLSRHGVPRVLVTFSLAGVGGTEGCRSPVLSTSLSMLYGRLCWYNDHS
jgi:hypothetical protein